MLSLLSHFHLHTLSSQLHRHRLHLIITHSSDHTCVSIYTSQITCHGSCMTCLFKRVNIFPMRMLHDVDVESDEMEIKTEIDTLVTLHKILYDVNIITKKMLFM